MGSVRDFILWPGPGVPNLADLYIDAALALLLVELFGNPQIDKKSLIKIIPTKKDVEMLKRFLSFCQQEIIALRLAAADFVHRPRKA